MSTDLPTEPSIDITVADGKYRFVQPQTREGSAAPIQAFRNGEPWPAANDQLFELRYTNWLWFLMVDSQETARALARANAKLEAAGLAVEHSTVGLPGFGGQQAAPGKAQAYGGTGGVLGTEC